MAPPTTLSFPNPLVIPPAAGLPHKQTFILLHGRGSSSARFGPALLCEHITAPTSPDKPPLPPHPHEGLTLASLFPHARFVFPTAPRQRATIYKRSVINQWFDDWHLEGPGGGGNHKNDELQVSGLRETVAYLHGLIRREAALLVGGAGRVVLGGLSQGCASSLVAALLWDGDGVEEEPLGAVVGMCGYLPYRVHIEEVVKSGLGAVADEDEDDGEFDPFDRGDDGPEIGDVKGERSPCQIAAAWLRDELDLPPASHSKSCGIERTPVFLGHGILDEKVAIQRGRDAARCLSDLGLNVTWKEYDGLGHWYSNDMLHEIVQFLLRENKMTS